MSVKRNISVNSFFGLPPPPPPLEEEEDHFSQPFNPLLQPPPPINDTLKFNNTPVNPIKILAGFPVDSAGEKRSSAHIDLMSCTESLGFESSDEMLPSLDDLGRSSSNNYNYNYNSNNNDIKLNNEEQEYSSSSCGSSSIKSRCLRRREKGVAKRWEERSFPPPLTSLSENGRRSFTLKAERKDGRLEIVGVMVEHPEMLCATRDNGRLTMHLVKTAAVSHAQYDEAEENEEEEAASEAEAVEEETEEERERRRPAAAGGIRRCYHQQRQMHVWGTHQHRFVTTI